MIVERFAFSALGFRLFFGRDIDGCVGLPASASFEAHAWPEDCPALAFDDGVVGYLIGHTEDGVPAIRALYESEGGRLRHGPTLPLGESRLSLLGVESRGAAFA